MLPPLPYHGGVDETSQRPKHPQRSNQLGTLAFYWRTVVTPYPRQAAVILLLMFWGAFLEAVTVGLTVPLLDVITAAGQIHQGHVVTIATACLRSIGMTPTTNFVIFTLMMIASLFFLARSGCVLVNQYYTAAIAVKLRRTMKASLFERFLNAQYEEMSRRARGMVVNDINQPAESIAGAITQLGVFLTGVFNTVLMVALLVYLSWWVTVLIGVLAIGGVQGWRWYADRRSVAHGRTLYRLLGEQNKLQVEAIDGLKVVKAHGLEREMVKRQDALLAAEFRPELQNVLFRNGPTVVNELLAIAIVLVLGAVTFLVPALGIRFSMLAAFLLAIRRIAPSMASISSASVNLSKYTRNLEVIEEVLTVMPQERRGGWLVGRAETIQLDALTFAYASRPDEVVLKGVSATMRRGTVTAIVGPTGSGKTTIANLLMGLYDAHGGTVLINGVDLGSLDLLAWRRKIGYVSQEVFVFNATIRDNIALGDDGVPMSQVEWAARVAQLDGFIGSLPDRYETLVGDRGLRLSGGQCQRLAIARAILRQPEVLIFDEATSALDTLTERAVYNAISSVHHDTVVIVIAHRLSTVREADQIVVLQDGRVIEIGTHSALIRQRGVYAKLYEEGDHAAIQGADEPEYAAANRAEKGEAQAPVEPHGHAQGTSSSTPHVGRHPAHAITGDFPHSAVGGVVPRGDDR